MHLFPMSHDGFVKEQLGDSSARSIAPLPARGDLRSGHSVRRIYRARRDTAAAEFQFISVPASVPSVSPW